ncbi:hypothetical protein ACIREO_19325 [Streptomyces sp. NPDC102441]|uniref:hypothetical protein n=1 Tax=Streptomyces sp. NPDC102441 TaxID=3366176 RepID=UPI00382706CD
MLDPELLERITLRRAELDELEERLVKQLTEVRAERDERAVAERVLERMTGELAEKRASGGPVPRQVSGRAVTLIPHREPGVEESRCHGTTSASSPPGETWNEVDLRRCSRTACAS